MNIRSFNYPNLINIFGQIESEKIGFYFSFCLHFIFLIFVIGFPDFFKSAPINIPTVIPIEIVNVTETTSIPREIDETKNQEKIVEKLKPKKFNNVENQEIRKIDIKTKPEKINKENKIIKEIKEEKNIEQNFKDLIELKDNQKVIEEEKIVSLPSKNIRPKRKPTLKKIETKASQSTDIIVKVKLKETSQSTDIIVKVQSKPKPNFDIASMMKDLRNDLRSMQKKKIENKIEEDQKIKDEVNQKKAQLSISEIDLLYQQLRKCWSAPAGAHIENDMIIKVSATIKPNRKVLEGSVRIVDTNISKSNRFYYAITESALRTLMNPKCSPLKLPEDKYDLWKSLTITFDHSNMRG